MHRSFVGSALAVASIALITATVSSPIASAEPLIPKETTIGPFITSASKNWGINDPSCKPTSQVKEPVVLIHGTSDSAAGWKKIAPALKDAGMCVWAFDYGADDRTLQDAIPPLKGLSDLEQSAKEVAAQIEYVREVTGFQKVNLVGHSQGGMHVKTYQQIYGKSENVARVVTLAGNIHGTDLNGTLGMVRKPLGANPEAAAFLFSTAGTQQVAGSPFMQKLNALPDTAAGTQYTAIYSPGDTTVTPSSAAQLKAVPGADVVNMDIAQVCGVSPWHAGLLINKTVKSQVIWGLTREIGEQSDPATCTG